MIIQLHPSAGPEERENLIRELQQLRIEPYPVTTRAGDYLVCMQKTEVDIRHIGKLPGVRDIHRVSGPHKLVSSKWKVGRTAITLRNGVRIGDGSVAMMAGPCSIESEAQITRVVEQLVRQGVRIMRGGVFKPRTNPYSFRGLGIEGLQLFYSICRAHGIAIITEVMEPSQIAPMEPYVDIYQVGARNSQNFNLLEALGEVDRPVMIKRGISGTIDELLYSAEYVFKKGNEQILLCERGIRTFETASRNTLDLNAIPILREKSHLPVVADPSHGIGIRRHVLPMALASVAAGADGVIVELDAVPEKTPTDGAQTIDFLQFDELMRKVRALEAVR